MCDIFAGADGEWFVQLRKGAVIWIPRAMKFDRCAPHNRTRTILSHDGPNHLRLRYTAITRTTLAKHGPNHLGLRCTAIPELQMCLPTSDVVCSSVHGSQLQSLWRVPTAAVS